MIDLDQFKHLFVPYKLILLTKECEFYEPCFARYLTDGSETLIVKEKNDISPDHQAPLYQQLINWLEDKHAVRIVDYPNEGWQSWTLYDGKWIFKYGSFRDDVIEKELKEIKLKKERNLSNLRSYYDYK